MWKVNVPEDQLLGGLGLLPQDRLGLTAEALLLPIVPGIGKIFFFSFPNEIKGIT